MKNSLSIICFCVALALAACTGNQRTEAGDSTGTGIAGARTPGNVTADTTRYDSTNTSQKSVIHKDSTTEKADTVKK